jgi:hypothetical protein
MMQTLDGLNHELQVLKQRTLRIENRVKELRCPGPTPLEMMTGGSTVLNRDATMSSQVLNNQSSHPPMMRGDVSTTASTSSAQR